ncbi:hypothetical protein THIX_20502 [Thiomonas sp. X19]|nr:hypothetical protein THIX_20502 [Thiomonas sp. X19]
MHQMTPLTVSVYCFTYQERSVACVTDARFSLFG